MGKLRIPEAHLDGQARGGWCVSCRAPRGAGGEPLAQAGSAPESSPLPVQATPTMGSLDGRESVYLWKDLIPLQSPRRRKAPPA